MIITPQSHLDHGLGEKVIAEIMSRFASRDASESAEFWAEHALSR